MSCSTEICICVAAQSDCSKFALMRCPGMVDSAPLAEDSTPISLVVSLHQTQVSCPVACWNTSKGFRDRHPLGPSRSHLALLMGGREPDLFFCFLFSKLACETFAALERTYLKLRKVTLWTWNIHTPSLHVNSRSLQLFEVKLFLNKPWIM